MKPTTLSRLAAALLCVATAQAAQVSIAEPSQGLAFTQREVADHAAIARHHFLAESVARNELACAAYCARIHQVWQRLLPVIRTQAQGQAAGLTLQVVRSPRADALSFADGQIIISENFITRLHLDVDQIAFVLAHEAAHVLLQHERQSLTSTMAILPSSVRRNVADVYSDIEAHYFSMEDELSVIAQQSELEADETGLLMAALAGFAPRRQLRFMEQLAVAKAGSSMVPSHPDAALRLEQLRQRLPLADRLFAPAGKAVQATPQS